VPVDGGQVGSADAGEAGAQRDPALGGQGRLVEVAQAPGTLRQVGRKDGRLLTTYLLHDALFERGAIESTGIKVVAHYKRVCHPLSGNYFRIRRREVVTVYAARRAASWLEQLAD